MEILYVIVGGGLVVAGYMLANMGKKQPKENQETEILPEYTPPATKNGLTIDEQVEAMMAYNPRSTIKQGGANDA